MGGKGGRSEPSPGSWRTRPLGDHGSWPPALRFVRKLLSGLVCTARPDRKWHSHGNECKLWPSDQQTRTGLWHTLLPAEEKAGGPRLVLTALGRRRPSWLPSCPIPALSKAAEARGLAVPRASLVSGSFPDFAPRGVFGSVLRDDPGCPGSRAPEGSTVGPASASVTDKASGFLHACACFRCSSSYQSDVSTTALLSMSPSRRPHAVAQPCPQPSARRPSGRGRWWGTAMLLGRPVGNTPAPQRLAPPSSVRFLLGGGHALGARLDTVLALRDGVAFSVLLRGEGRVPGVHQHSEDTITASPGS